MLRLLHLSDLHFGDHSRFKGQDPKKVGKSFHRALVDAEPSVREENRVDVVIVTGDLAEVGKPKEFEAAREFLAALAGELGIERRRFVFCPGNHDVSRTACKKVELDQMDEDFDDDELRRRMDLVKLERYAGFLTDFYGEPLDGFSTALGKRHQARVHSFPELRLTVGALDSCEKESHRREDHVGFVSPEQAQALMDHWRFGEATSWLKVVAVHHNPDVTVPENMQSWADWMEGHKLTSDQIAAWTSDVVGFEGREQLKNIVKDCEVQLVLHGHHHAKDDHVWSWNGDGYGHVLSAGSLSLVDKKLPGSEPPSFRLIDLDTENERLKARAYLYFDWARTAGEVETGAFKPDPDGDYEKRLDLPDSFVAEGLDSRQRVKAEHGELAGYVRTLRTAFKGAYQRWDLAVGVAQSGGAGRPIEVGLDEMYVPLRLGEGYSLDSLNRGSVIEPETILGRRQPLAIRGAAGSGKTTWMRWTFRRLLEAEEALPLMLVLRDLARHWSVDRVGEERSLEGFLDHWAAEQIGSGWERGYVKKLLETGDGPVPVLLVDGWDELGSLGREVRRKLAGVMALYPRMRVVVSSRPYGEARPSGSEGFEVLDLQPLSGGTGDSGTACEIEALAESFFTRCHRGDQGGLVTSTEDFLDALGRSRDAQDLARTPLLLTMMLLISRSRPLPDKRHDLYEACIDNLLTARIKRKEKEGAQLLDNQWRPEDGDERKRAVAQMAYALRLSRPKSSMPHDKRAVVASWDDAIEALPDSWSLADRRGFVDWLAGPAGILVDRSDEKLVFVHLSFQEYLVAWHLDATVEGKKERVEFFQNVKADSSWRETLLLWSARIHQRSPSRLDEVLASLDGEFGLALSGYAFADGLGTEEAFRSWAERLVDELGRAWSHRLRLMAQAWAACRQGHRKGVLLDSANREASRFFWFSWVRVEDWCRRASLPGKVSAPVSRLVGFSLKASRGQIKDAGSVALSRLFSGGPTFYPPEQNIGFLHVWPGSRRLLGSGLQGLVVVDDGVGSWNLSARNAWLASRIESLNLALSDTEIGFDSDSVYFSARNSASDVAFGFARDFAQDFGHRLSPYKARYFAHDFAHDFASYFASYYASFWARDLARDLAGDFARDFASYFAGGGFTSYFARDFASYSIPNWLAGWLPEGCPESEKLADFGVLELFSIGRYMGRGLLAAYRGTFAPPEAQILAPACRLTDVGADADTAEFDEAIKRYSPKLHPLWPALARHLARRSTDEDRELLEALAREPEKHVEDGPLRWGLQYIVRGDVLQEDGTVLRLDDALADAGLDPLPYLEDPPPPLDIDWDENTV